MGKFPFKSKLMKKDYSRHESKLVKYSEELLVLIDSLEKKITLYQKRVKRNKRIYKSALQTSKEEIWEDFENILTGLNNNKKIDIPAEMVGLGRDLVGSSIWVTRAYLKYMKSIVRLPLQRVRTLDERHLYVFNIIKNHLPLDDYEVSTEEVFQCIFAELSREQENDNYITPLEFPKIKTTIVLVSGVLNELYKTAAFERGVQYLCENYGMNYLAPKVHGRKGSTYNARLLEEQLEEYVKENPGEKLWLITYSKGGIDTLHFLKRNSEFADKHIVGLSTIASPIQGSPHTDHRLVKLLDQLNKLEHTYLYKMLDNGRDLLLKNVPRFLSTDFQERWFKRNQDHLPKNIFYSSLALESEWYKAHVWMILAKVIFKSKSRNDGIVDVEKAHFPENFEHINFGVVKGHHLISARSTTFNQEALIEAHILTLSFLGYLK